MGIDVVEHRAPPAHQSLFRLMSAPYQQHIDDAMWSRAAIGREPN
jgi:hypothetical protein